MNRRRVLWLALAALVAAPWIFGGEPKRLDDGARRRASGQFAKLKQGRTHFLLSGPSPAEVVVFVHGLTSPSSIWGDLPDRVRRAGYRTLVYDLYGRGWSDRPKVGYDLDLFDRQLTGLLARLGLRKKVHLVGFSLGAVIASEFALRHPDRVAGLTLLSPAGFGVSDATFLEVVRFPVLGDWLVQVFGDRALARGLEGEVHDRSRVRDLLRQFRPQLEYRGYKRAVLSTLRGVPLEDFTSRYVELGRSGMPVAVFWGTEDTVTPFSSSARARELLPAVAFHPVEDAGHLAHYEKTDAVFDPMLAFLRGVEAPRQKGVAVEDAGPRRRHGEARPAGAQAPGPRTRDCPECGPPGSGRRPTGSYSRPPKPKAASRHGRG